MPTTQQPRPARAGETQAIASVLARDASGANGDDAAIVRLPGALGCISTDAAVEGVHLHPSLTPWQMGYRAAACALSDLAAMAATPRAVVCAIATPSDRWEDAPLAVQGVADRAREAGCDLVGGDFVATGDSARFSITVTVLGGGAGLGRHGLLARAGAREGDAVYVTGWLGESAAALASIDAAAGGSAPGASPCSRDAYRFPPDRTRAARVLASSAHSMIDLSDGLASDAAHVVERSGVGMRLDLDALPVRAATARVLGAGGQDAHVVAASHGDDYELLFTVSPEHEHALCDAVARVDPLLPLTRIGECADTDLVLRRCGKHVIGVHGFAHG